MKPGAGRAHFPADLIREALRAEAHADFFQKGRRRFASGENPNIVVGNSLLLAGDVQDNGIAREFDGIGVDLDSGRSSGPWSLCCARGWRKRKCAWADDDRILSCFGRGGFAALLHALRSVVRSSRLR